MLQRSDFMRVQVFIYRENDGYKVILQRERPAEQVHIAAQEPCEGPSKDQFVCHCSSYLIGTRIYMT